jgi:hypothetical protein
VGTQSRVCSDTDRTLVLESRGANEDDVDAGLLERLGSFESLDLLEGPAYSSHDTTEVHGWLHSVEAEAICAAQVPGDARRFEQSLARRTPVVGAVSTNPLLLDQRHMRAESGGVWRCPHSRRASPDHHQVVLVHHLVPCHDRRSGSASQIRLRMTP